MGQNVYWGCKSWEETEASVQAGLEYWGLSLSLRATGEDQGQTR